MTFVNCLFQFGDETPLHLAVRFKNPEIVQLFLEREDLDPNKGNKVRMKLLPELYTFIMLVNPALKTIKISVNTLFLEQTFEIH